MVKSTEALYKKFMIMINSIFTLFHFQNSYKRMNLLKEKYKNKADSAVPYIATLYYAEILYLMFFINFLYGKIFSVTAGVSLSIILTLHVIKLFYKKNVNRKIQLYLMDFHCAYSSVYFINRLFSGYTLTSVDYAVICFRLCTALIEFMLIIVLTDRNITKEYSD